MKFRDIPRMTFASYQCNVSWDYLEQMLKTYRDNYGMELNPDFQRGHVWTDQQRVSYIEWILKGGRSGKDIHFNCPGWKFGGGKGNMVCVDGLQRLTAVRRFLKGKIAIFGGHFFKDFEDSPGMLIADFIFNVNDLPTRVEVLQWYLDLNSGGTDHTPKELTNVRKLLTIEKGKDTSGKDTSGPNDLSLSSSAIITDVTPLKSDLNYKWIKWVFTGSIENNTDRWTTNHVQQIAGSKTLCDKSLPDHDSYLTSYERPANNLCKICERRLNLFTCIDCGHYVPERYCPKCGKDTD